MYIFVILFFSVFVDKCYLQYPFSNKDQRELEFHNSLHQMNAFLEDVEGKVKKEREILDQFHYEDFTEPSGFLDYDVTDIWWSKLPVFATTKLGTPISTIPPGYIGIPYPTKNNTAAPTDGYTYPAGVGEPLPEAPPAPGADNKTDYQLQQEQSATTGHQGQGQEPPGANTTQGSHEYQPPLDATHSPSNTTNIMFKFGGARKQERLIMSTKTTQSQFQQQLQEEMQRQGAGYITVSAMKLFELIARKPREQLAALLEPLGHMNLNASESEHRVLRTLREPLYTTVMSASRMLAAMPSDVIKSEASRMYTAMKSRRAVMAADLRAVLGLADTLVSDQQGGRMFRALEDLEHYPAGGKSAGAVIKEVVESALDPYTSLSGGGSAKPQRLVDTLNRALQVRLAGPGGAPAGSGRRSLASKLKKYGKVVDRIFHSKHDTNHRHGPRHRHGGERKHHHRPAHLPRRHHRATPHGIPIQHDHGNKDRDTRQYSTTNIPQKTNKPRIPTKYNNQKRYNVIKRERNYAAEAKRRYKTNIPQKTNKPRIPTKYNNQKRYNVIKRERNYAAEAKRRYHSDQRIGTDSTTRTTTENQLLRNIIEGSDKSDEEERLRANVYAAVYHGNELVPGGAGGAGGRREGGALGGAFSDTDDEAVLKSRIYRYFGYNPDLEIRELAAA